ncbi:Glycerol-3-phosphate transporter [Candidatus Hepatincola sp. Av]
MFWILKPAPITKKLAKEEIDPVYKRLRIQVFLSIFIGYAVYYFVRKNVALAAPAMIEHGWTKTHIGFVMASLSCAYAFSKFFMGSISDKSNPRYFLPLGLLISGLITLYVGFSDLTFGTMSLGLLTFLMFLNGWAQGMGWPPCGKTIVHWYSVSERGKTVSVWNLAHNFGGGLIANISIWGVGYFNDWQATFYVPAGIAVATAVVLLLTLKDKPQSCGLPPIEEFKNDYPPHFNAKLSEEDIPLKRIFTEYIFPNKFLWFIAIANAFVYLVRNGVVDWAPTYLSETKHFTFQESGWAYALYEYAAIPGTLICGYISDKLFKARRGPTGVIFMVLTFVSLTCYWVSTSSLSISISLILTGLLIYGPVMLIGLHALDLVPSQVAGTAAGFTGMFGYLIGDVLSKAIMGKVIDSYGWNVYFVILIAATLGAALFLSFTWNQGRK